MEKILFVTDAIKLNMQNLDFASFLCNLTHSRLTGVFLENLEQEERSREAIQHLAAAGSSPKATVRTMKDECCSDNIKRFEQACEVRGVNCNVHRDKGVPVNEVIEESRYADLIVINAETSFTQERESIPTKFAKSILSGAECPVVIAPDSFDGVNEIIFTYDGGRSSVYAIKQFTYLFPQLHDRKVTIFTVKDHGTDTDIHKYKLKEWLRTHYSNIDFVVMEDENTRARLLEHLLSKEKAFIVMGAYGRGMLSDFFNPSHASPVVKLVSQPVFITHY